MDWLDQLLLDNFVAIAIGIGGAVWLLLTWAATRSASSWRNTIGFCIAAPLFGSMLAAAFVLVFVVTRNPAATWVLMASEPSGTAAFVLLKGVEIGALPALLAVPIFLFTDRQRRRQTTL